MSALRQWAGSLGFTAYLFLSVPFYATFVLVAAPFTSRAFSYSVATHWAGSVLYVLAKLCHLEYAVQGEEHIDRDCGIALVKHSSAWETIAQLKVFPRQTWVLKRELLWAPFLGWVLPRFNPIAINRKAGRSAVEQVLEQGRERLRDGYWLIIYPEGTRMPAGESGRFGLSGALLASSTGHPLIPVAHNAGEFWPRRGWLKRPGVIRVAIGPPIASEGRDPRSLNEEAREWIDRKLAEFSHSQGV